MENNNIEDSRDAERPAIPVVNGEAKPSTGKAKKVLFSLLTLVLIAGAGVTGYLYSQEKTTSATLDSQLESANSKLSSLQGQLDQINADTADSAQEKLKAPEGYQEYTDPSHKFSLFYPNTWKDFKPNIESVEDYRAEYSGGPSLQYKAESEAWIVADAKGNGDYSKGDSFTTDIARKDRAVTVYDFSTSDKNCKVSKLVFIDGKNAVELESPKACNQDEKDSKKTDELDEQTEEVAFSIQFTQP